MTIWVGFMKSNAITYDLSRIKGPTLSMERERERERDKDKSQCCQYDDSSFKRPMILMNWNLVCLYRCCVF